jgi:hypothetical protein
MVAARARARSATLGTNKCLTRCDDVVFLAVPDHLRGLGFQHPLALDAERLSRIRHRRRACLAGYTDLE